MTTFTDAQQIFRQAPTNETAGEYLTAALYDEGEDIISGDDFFNAVSEVALYLEG